MYFKSFFLQKYAWKQTEDVFKVQKRRYVNECWGYLPSSQTQNWHSWTIIQLYGPGHLWLLRWVHLTNELRQNKQNEKHCQLSSSSFSPRNFLCWVNVLFSLLTSLSRLCSLPFLSALSFPSHCFLSLSSACLTPVVNYWTNTPSTSPAWSTLCIHSKQVRRRVLQRSLFS